MALKRPIYLDHAATTKIDPRVLDKMLPFLTEEFGNPASQAHVFGWSAEKAVENARKQVAATVGCDRNEIIWTSGATESINLALKGAANFYQNRGKHLITIKTEHKATLDTMHELERTGFRVTYLVPERSGLIDLDKLSAAICQDTILVSVMLVNNEVGVIQDIAAIGALCREKKVIFHVDAAQAVGKVEFNLKQIDLMSFSAHKAYGPKGVGALYVCRHPRIDLMPIIHGGGHERGFRSGTLAPHQIVGMGEAFAIAGQEMQAELPRIRALRDQLLQGLQSLEAIHVNGDLSQSAPHYLNISFVGVEADALMRELKELAVSSGSACTSASLEPSHVLQALGISDTLARSSIRFTIGRFNSAEEIDYSIQLVTKVVNKLRDSSPLWEMFKEGIAIGGIENEKKGC